ncbi:putative Na(+)/H(+) antiporter [Flavobacteriaceae bacterium UJ101]|nr:putative Na(+)/H(+) antiporter [Flavobacteriaceae bacterium UJ101]
MHMRQERPISLIESLIPIVVLIFFLAVNYQVFGDGAAEGPNQFGLILGAGTAMIIAYFIKIPFSKILEGISENIRETVPAILILLLVGALAGTWMLSGIVPAMIYYGMQILNPTIFLFASVIIAALVSIATGSSWTTSATIGIALIGIGNSLGIDSAMTAGAVISGAYFGDKMSPMSDTTNLAPAMAGTDLITHIKYMTITTFPSIVITLILFLFLGFSLETNGGVSSDEMLQAMAGRFNITPWLFVVPIVVVGLIIRKIKPFVALLIGVLLGVLFALIFQQELMSDLIKIAAGETGDASLNVKSIYQLSMQTITGDLYIETGNAVLDDRQLFSSGGMAGMLNTIFLIVSAMIFGGAMQAIGALEKLSYELLRVAKGVFGLFASTVASCIGLNVLASDQYLAIVVPGRMFKEAYREKGLAPENLSRTLEDSGTVTSVLIPWNTCGAYQSTVLTVDVMAYLPYAFFNLISPFMTLLIAAIGYKIRKLKES